MSHVWRTRTQRDLAIAHIGGEEADRIPLRERRRLGHLEDQSLGREGRNIQ